MLLEDQKLFRTAGDNWTRLLNEFVPGGLPQPIRFLGQRPTFAAFGAAADDFLQNQLLVPAIVSIFVDRGFKDVYPPAAAKRSQQRILYFDLFFEAYRSSARGYTTPDLVAKIKGGQETANQKLADIGQKFFDLLMRNDDVPPETKEEIKELLEKTPAMKKKFDELMATAPKMGG